LKQQHPSLTRKIIVNALKAGVTIGILAYLYQKGMLDLSRVRAVLSNGLVVSFCLSMLVMTTLAGVVRWRLLLLGQNLKISLWECLRLTMIGTFFNTAIPGAVSGDLVKGFYVVRQQPDGRGRIRAFTTLLLDRVVGLSALICVSFFAMILNYRQMAASPTLKPLCGLITMLWIGVLVFFAFVLVDTKVARKLQKLLHAIPGAGQYVGKLFEAVKAYESCRHYILKGFLISIGIHCTIMTVFIVLANALGGFENVPAAKFFFLAPFGLLVTAIPVAPAGLGTGHAAFLGLFQLAGSKSGADLFTAFVTFQILISLIGGIFYVRYRHHVDTRET
jgi:uncharacterized protein (TIRG00374 family)